jgi:hypothetical protein
VELRGGFVGFGNTPTAPRGQLLVHRRRERLGPPVTVNARTGAGYVSPKEGDYARAEAMGVRVILVTVEAFGGLGPAARWWRSCAGGRSGVPTKAAQDIFMTHFAR